MRRASEPTMRTLARHSYGQGRAWRTLGRQLVETVDGTAGGLEEGGLDVGQVSDLEALGRVEAGIAVRIVSAADQSRVVGLTRRNRRPLYDS
jgi:hypothetical protein